MVTTFLRAYSGPLELKSLLDAAILETNLPKGTIVEVLDFLGEVKGTTLPAQAQNGRFAGGSAMATIDVHKKLNLGEEISYAYQIAKALVEDEVNKVGVHDSEEIRKSVREMHRFLESALKMQERLHGVDEARRFVESVLQILEDVDPALRELAVVRLLDSQI
jgi:hypothetical protein